MTTSFIKEIQVRNELAQLKFTTFPNSCQCSLEIYSKITLNSPECSPKVHLNVHFMPKKARKSEKMRANLK